MQLLAQSVIDGLAIGAIYAMAAVTFGVIYDVTKVFHIAFGSVGTLGTFVAVAHAGDRSDPARIIVGIVMGVALAALATVLLLVLVYEPLRRRGGDTGALFVASLGMGTLIQALVVLRFGPNSRSFAVTDFVHRTEWVNVDVSRWMAACLLGGLVLVGAVAVVLDRTRTGHRVRALASNPEQAALVGISARRYSIVACAIAGGLAVIPFVLFSMNGAVLSTGGTNMTLIAVLAVLTGGASRTWLTAATGLGLGVVSGLAAVILPGQWSTSVVFVVAVVIVMARPKGIALRTATA